MCGIAGLYAYLDVAPPVDRAELSRMNARMAPRGPDGSGDWFSADGRVGFTHRRLAIIDLSERGPSMVEALRGMFALGLWDARSRQLLLARDPLGIKPLYYADDGWTIRFASQAKALLAGGAVSRDPDPAGIVGFHLFGSVPDPFTVWRGIRAVPAGATILVDAAGPEAPRHYYD